MRINILTLFPEMFNIFNESVIGKAKENNIFELNINNIRDYSLNKHKKVDDYPFGGGSGMVLMCQPVIDAILDVKKVNKGKVYFLGPRGNTFNHDKAKEMSKEKEVIILCGHYEGMDERIYDYVDEEISLGDFILTGGEMAAVPIIDSILRLVPGVLGTFESTEDESFIDNTLEYPQYTRPENFEGKIVPKVLLSGHHENIRKWRRYKSLEITKERRNDLFSKLELTKDDVKIVSKIKEISLGEIENPFTIPENMLNDGNKLRAKRKINNK